MSLDARTRICLWIRALNADWLTVALVSYILLMYPQHRIQRKNIVTIFFDKNDGRHIAKPRTSPMWNSQGIIPTKYLKDRFIIVGGVSFWKKKLTNKTTK